MADDQTRVEDESMKSLFKKLNKHKLMRLISREVDFIHIFGAILLLYMIPQYIAQIKSVSILTIAIAICLRYLIYGYLITPEVEKKCEGIVKRWIKKLVPKLLKIREYTQRKDYKNMLDQNKVLKRRYDTFKREHLDLLRRFYDLQEKLKGVEEKKASALKEIEDKYHRDMVKKHEELFDKYLSRLEREEKERERELVSQLEDKCEILKKCLDSERLAHKSCMEREDTLETELEIEYRNLERKLEEARVERVEYLDSIGEELDELKALIEKNSEEAEQKKYKTMEEERNAMLKMVANLEEERDEMAKENKELRDCVTRSASKGLEEKLVTDTFKRVTDMFTERMMNNDEISEKMLENQDTLLKLLSQTKSRLQGDFNSDDDSYEVVDKNY